MADPPRNILESDVIHVRRANGRNLDAILHVAPGQPIKGLLMVWNPAEHQVEQELVVPVYYTGLSDWASVAQEDGRRQRVRLDREFRIRLKPKIRSGGWTWYVIR